MYRSSPPDRGPHERSLELRIFAAEGRRHRSLPGLRQRLAPDPACCHGGASLSAVERLQHEYALRCELDADWAARPIALTHYNGRAALVLEDPGGEPLDRLLGRPLDVPNFLRIAIPLAGHSAGCMSET
jgi:hypothetical protein